MVLSFGQLSPSLYHLIYQRINILVSVTAPNTVNFPQNVNTYFVILLDTWPLITFYSIIIILEMFSEPEPNIRLASNHATNLCFSVAFRFIE